MTEEELSNIDKPAHVDWAVTASEAIKCINRLLDSDEVQEDDYADAMMVKAFIVDTLPNVPVPVKHSKTIPVMETTIEGAQKRIVEAIEWTEWFIGAMEKAMEDDGYPAPTWPSLRTMATNLEYIGVFLDSVGDEMAAISSAHNSLHDRYVKALVAIDEWKDNFEAVDMAASRRLDEITELQREITELRRENGELRRSSLSSIHAAHDNR